MFNYRSRVMAYIGSLSKKHDKAKVVFLGTGKESEVFASFDTVTLTVIMLLTNEKL